MKYIGDTAVDLDTFDQIFESTPKLKDAPKYKDDDYKKQFLAQLGLSEEC